jgi:3-methylcrotonyl-CoA carboxylase alpha subunit
VLESVLIANRGEIACRIIRTAKRLGMRTVVVHSEADADALFVRMADEAHLIGPAPARESYLQIDRILEVAKRTGAACIHPGYGFLSERAEFAEACVRNGIVFVGPPASAIKAMGLKDAAKALVQQAGVPVVPGYHGSRQDPDFLRQKAYEIGYPVLIKAVAGGGGKGMRRVEKAADFDAALESAQREAQSAFGDPRVLVEKYILAPRHIEIQVFADQEGNVVHLFERDCSLQRRHQKVIEEAPAPGMPPEMREIMGKAAVEAARAVGYVGAGTVEFIADGREGLRPDRFYFMEMNTRLQVEHPVTEAITGLDLVELQFRVASGEWLPFNQDDLEIRGHAVEARLYAEDPEREFLPSTGKLWGLDFPHGEELRIDTGVQAGDEVTPYYDPMIAKVIAHGATREMALARLAEALGKTIVAGPKTNVAFLKNLCEAKEFGAGQFDTGYIDRHLKELGAAPQPIDYEAASFGVAELILQQARQMSRGSRANHSPDLRSAPWSTLDGFMLLGSWQRKVRVEINGEVVDADLEWHAAPEAPEKGKPSVGLGPIAPSSRYADWRETGFESEQLDSWNEPIRAQELGVTFVGGGSSKEVFVLRDGRQSHVRLHDPFDVDLEHLDGGDSITAPMHGKLVALFVQPGDRVEKGQRLAVVEAMKMEHVLVAPTDGEVAEIAAEPGAQVAEGARLIVLRAQE